MRKDQQINLNLMEFKCVKTKRTCWLYISSAEESGVGSVVVFAVGVSLWKINNQLKHSTLGHVVIRRIMSDR